MSLLSPDTVRHLLPILVGLPIVLALIFACLGGRTTLVKRLAVGGSLLHLLLTVFVILSAMKPLADRKAAGERDKPTDRTTIFVPEFVPGDPGKVVKNSDGTFVRIDSHTTTWNLVPISHDNSDLRPIQFFIGLDGLNLWLLGLASVMLFPVVLISLDTIRERQATYFAWLFLLQGLVIGVFLAFDIILFYVCFELTLIPLFFLISQWGLGPNRREAARKLFLFTLAGGLITLVGIAAIVLEVYHFAYTIDGRTHHYLTFSIPELAQLMHQQLDSGAPPVKDRLINVQFYLFLALVAGFLVKIPLIPFHSWLPGAYAEAPIGVTVLLSALLAKMGTFGLLRICLPLTPDAVLTVGLPIVGSLAAVGIIYAALCAYAQPDFKRMIAYSSVSHLGFCALALVAFNAEGIAGSTLHMVNHGLSTGALFLLVGLLLKRYTSQQMTDFSGTWKKLPRLTFFMMVMVLASIGLPGLNNFVSEMLMLGSLFDLRNPKASGILLAIAAAIGIFLGAWYMLTMMQRVFFGPWKEPLPAQPGEIRDIHGYEWAILIPLTVLCLWLGVAPQPVLDTMKRDVDTLARVANEARRGHEPLPPLPKITISPSTKETMGKKDGGKGKPKKPEPKFIGPPTPKNKADEPKADLPPPRELKE